MSGYKTRAGFKIETNEFGVPETIGAGNQLYLRSESLTDMYGASEIFNLIGGASARDLVFISRTAVGGIIVEPMYGYLDLFACALGKSHVNSPTLGTGTTYVHWFEPDVDLADRPANEWDRISGTATLRRRGTLVLYKNAQDFWQYASVMVNGFIITANALGITFEFDLIARGAQINPRENTSVASWTFPTTADGGRISFSQIYVAIKPRDLFTITWSEDAFVIYESGNYVTMTCTTGTYTGHELAKHIEGLMNDNATLLGRYNVEYDSSRRRFIFSGDTSFSIRGTHGNMEMERVLGFYTNTPMATYHVSERVAGVDDFSVWSNDDKINVSELQITYRNNLTNEGPDSVSQFLSQQPFCSEPPRVNLRVNLPRYTNSNIIKSLNSDDVYEIYVLFDGGTIGVTNYQIEFYLPQVKLTDVQANVAGAHKIERHLTFTAIEPRRWFNFKKYTFTDYYDYYVRQTPQTSASNYLINALAIHNLSGVERPAVWAVIWDTSTSAMTMAYLENVSWTHDVTNIITGYTPSCAIGFPNGYIFVGCSSGRVYSYGGTSVGWNLERTMGTTTVVDLCMHGEYLFAINSAGLIDYYDGTTWANSTNLSATTSFKLYSWKGNLYAIASVSSYARVYKFDGTSWTNTYTFTKDATNMTIAGNEDYLYVTADDYISFYNGTTWAALTALPIAVKHSIFYADQLIFFSASTTAVYSYNFNAEDVSTLFNTNALTATAKPVIFEEKMLITLTASRYANWFSPCKQLTMSISNGLSLNPFA